MRGSIEIGAVVSVGSGSFFKVKLPLTSSLLSVFLVASWFVL